MHRIVVLRPDRGWARPNNHFDVRICPVCHLMVAQKNTKGRDQIAAHLAWHQQIDDLVGTIHTLADRLGISLDGDSEMAWTAAVDGKVDEIEATQ